MLIGVDCQHLTEDGRTGTHNYLYNLLKNLAVLDLQNEYMLYFKHAPSDGFWGDISKNNRNWRYKVVKPGLSWVQMGLSRQTFLDGPNRLLCSWHTLPILHNPTTKIVSVIHDFSYRGYKELFMYASLFMSDTLVGVSNSTFLQIVKRVPWKKKNTFMIYEGVDTSKYKKSNDRSIDAVRRRFGIPDRFFLSVGTLDPRKNLETMLKAVSLLLVENPNINAKYVLVGRCAKGYEYIYKYASTLLKERVLFLGRLSDDTVVDLYSAASALLYVSLQEGFGLPVLEALACGCPVITSNVSSTAEIGNESVFLADPGDPQSIKSALYSVLTDQERKENKMRLGLEKVKIFTWKSCAEKFLEIL